MGKPDKIAAACRNIGSTLSGIIKILLQSRIVRQKKSASPKGNEIVILGNGPSLNTTIAESTPFLKKRNLLAVNFAANTPLFAELKPNLYVLADPHFFRSDAENVEKLWTVLSSVDWTMNLYVPTRIKSERISEIAKNKNITICRYNLTPIEGFQWFRNFAYRTGLGMPRPRNVLIPSIMIALNAGYKTIYVAGADHSWMQTLSVDDENHVVSIQPHFYADNDKEKKRVSSEYTNYPLHQIIYSFYVAFKSYHDIQKYAKAIGSTIWNITPGSFIDAFPRKKL